MKNLQETEAESSRKPFDLAQGHEALEWFARIDADLKTPPQNFSSAHLKKYVLSFFGLNPRKFASVCGPAFRRSAFALAAVFFLSGCAWLNEPPKPRLVMFVGVDVSGSFIQGKDFDDALTFLSEYLYAHLNGLEGLEKPAALFVGTIGGDKAGQPKAFFPIETFQDKSPEEIKAQLQQIFPTNKVDAWTDFNAFFDKISEMIKDRRMVLKPLSILMLSDGMLDVPTNGHRNSYKDIDLMPLEKLSRNVTIRLLYTSPTVGKKWESEVPRHRVKVWTQEAPVMETWKDPKIFLPATPPEKQDKFLSWVKDNVDFNVRMKRVD